jgi:hypothetical protein
LAEVAVAWNEGEGWSKATLVVYARVLGEDGEMVGVTRGLKTKGCSEK